MEHVWEIRTIYWDKLKEEMTLKNYVDNMRREMQR